ncbi:MAG: hypothetical protein K6G09_05930 [Treponema sp.]|nr:hypothetical protein [Treponema sp.]
MYDSTRNTLPKKGDGGLFILLVIGIFKLLYKILSLPVKAIVKAVKNKKNNEKNSVAN